MEFLKFSDDDLLNKIKILIMRKFLYILIAFIGFSYNSSAQVAGDYRSVSSGNWNDPTKWETYNGSAWISTTVYPGENSGTGTVTIMDATEIKISANIPNHIADIFVGTYNPGIVPSAFLTFSAESALSLTVSGNVEIAGELRIDNQNGAKTHTLFIGRNLTVLPLGYDGNPEGTYNEECGCYIYTQGVFQTINEDDKLGVTFNPAGSPSEISSLNSISFQDITFNGTGIQLNTNIDIRGTATFINGIVTPDEGGNVRIIFIDGSTVSGASNVSYVDGFVQKNGDDLFTFPIGNEGVYAPLAISGLVAEETFYAYYRRNSGAGQGPITDPALYSLSDCEFWSLQAPGNVVNSPYNLTAGWTSDVRCGAMAYITNVSDITLARWNHTNWATHGGTGTGTTTNGSVTWSGLTSLGEFTLANLSTSCRTPAGLPTTNITSNSATVNWSAETGAGSYDVDYKSISTNTWTNAATATTSTSINLSGLNSLITYVWRVKANCSSSSSIYREAQFTTLAVSCRPPSGLLTTNITSNSATVNWSAETGAGSYDVDYKSISTNTWTNAATATTSTSINLSGLNSSITYVWRVKANCSSSSSIYSEAQFTTLAVCGSINAYETNNTSAEAKAISLGTTIFAGLSSATDVDWFKVTTPNSSIIALKVSLSNLPADYDLYIYNKSLKLIATSAASGTSDEVVTYNSTARNATYYIKIAGKNGAYNTSQCYNLLAQTISSSAKSRSSASEPVNEITEILNNQLLYPNPASEVVYLRFTSDKEGAANVQILNSANQVVKQYPVSLTKGNNQIQIPVNDIRPGIYLIRINNARFNMIRRFVIAR